MTIPASILGGIICLLLSVLVHQLNKLIDKVTTLSTAVAVHETRIKMLERETHSKHLRSATV